MSTTTAYMREYRARTGGLTMSDRVQRIARDRAIGWVRDELPDVWRIFLEDARRELGLPVELSPAGHFTKPIEHGTPAGASAHRYRGEQPCPACHDAYKRYRRERYAACRVGAA